MHSNSFDNEISLLKEIAGLFPRHPLQKNQLLESDAEILDFKNKKIDYLVLKTDGIYEEISEKLYEDPWLIGWMSITVTISDIAAVAADPFGILLSLQLTKPHDTNWLTAFQKGINDACEAYGVFILGGDTNFTASLSVSSTAVAVIKNNKPLYRKKILPGELLYSTSVLGVGNAFAYSRYFDSSLKINYQPLARLRESKLIQQYATACIDTSDGLFPAISVLSAINKVGIRFITPLQNILHADAAKTCQQAMLPAWMMLAGPHGEYELLFSIPVSKKEKFETACAADNWQPVLLGTIITNRVIHFFSETLKVKCSPYLIADLFQQSNGNIQLYFDMLLQQHKKWNKN